MSAAGAFGVFRTPSDGWRSAILHFAAGVDLLVDGCLIGVGFATRDSTGVFLSIALSMEAILPGLSLAATMVRGGWRRGKISEALRRIQR